MLHRSSYLLASIVLFMPLNSKVSRRNAYQFPDISDSEIVAFRERVFAFFALHARDFPWRHLTDRYAVMVSEVMLQQTQADRVVSRFTDWLIRFPDVQSLAASSRKDLLSAWNGLGYNSRAIRMQQAAIKIIECFDGQVPADPVRLATLPGIGAYASRSIPAFADNLDVAAVDTNVRRIIHHAFAISESASNSQIQLFAERLLPAGQSRDWHNALMDYGALCLTSRATGIRPKSRQKPFRHSRRWYRGQLLKELLAVESLLLEELETKYAAAPWAIRGIIDEMSAEGLLDPVCRDYPEGPEIVRIGR